MANSNMENKGIYYQVLDILSVLGLSEDSIINNILDITSLSYEQLEDIITLADTIYDPNNKVNQGITNQQFETFVETNKQFLLEGILYYENEQNYNFVLDGIKAPFSQDNELLLRTFIESFRDQINQPNFFGKEEGFIKAKWREV